MAKGRYVKVALFERCATSLQDAKVVGQADDYLLLERAAPKPRATNAAPRKRKAAKAPSTVKVQAAETAVV